MNLDGISRAVIVCFALLVSLQVNAETFLDYPVNLGKQTVRLYLNDSHGKPLGQFERLEQMLASRGERLVFAMNAGIFMTDLRPLGLYVEDGKVFRRLVTRLNGHGNFYMQPNGVFYIDENGAAILPTGDYKQHVPEKSVRFATQSGPLLVIRREINPNLPMGSTSKLIRNAVCVISSGSIVLSISEHPVTFREFAQHLLNLKCRDALYLDGGISDAYWPARGRIASLSSFGPMIGISELVR